MCDVIYIEYIKKGKGKEKKRLKSELTMVGVGEKKVKVFQVKASMNGNDVVVE